MASLWEAKSAPITAECFKPSDITTSNTKAWDRVAVPPSNPTSQLTKVWKRVAIPQDAEKTHYQAALRELNSQGRGRRVRMRGSTYVPASGDGTWHHRLGSKYTPDGTWDLVEARAAVSAHKAQPQTAGQLVQADSSATFPDANLKVVPRKRHSNRHPVALPKENAPMIAELQPKIEVEVDASVQDLESLDESSVVKQADNEQMRRRSVARLSRRFSLAPIEEAGEEEPALSFSPAKATMPFFSSPLKRRAVMTPRKVAMSPVSKFTVSATPSAPIPEESEPPTPAAAETPAPTSRLGLATPKTPMSAMAMVARAAQSPPGSGLGLPLLFDQPTPEIDELPAHEAHRRSSTQSARRSERRSIRPGRSSTDMSHWDGLDRLSSFDRTALYLTNSAHTSNHHHPTLNFHLSNSESRSEVTAPKDDVALTTATPSIEAITSHEETINIAQPIQHSSPPTEVAVDVDMRTNRDIFGQSDSRRSLHESVSKHQVGIAHEHSSTSLKLRSLQSSSLRELHQVIYEHVWPELASAGPAGWGAAARREAIKAAREAITDQATTPNAHSALPEQSSPMTNNLPLFGEHDMSRADSVVSGPLSLLAGSELVRELLGADPMRSFVSGQDQAQNSSNDLMHGSVTIDQSESLRSAVLDTSIDTDNFSPAMDSPRSDLQTEQTANLQPNQLQTITFKSVKQFLAGQTVFMSSSPAIGPVAVSSPADAEISDIVTIKVEAEDALPAAISPVAASSPADTEMSDIVTIKVEAEDALPAAISTVAVSSATDAEMSDIVTMEGDADAHDATSEVLAVAKSGDSSPATISPVAVSSSVDTEMSDIVTMESEADALEVESSKQFAAPGIEDSPPAATSAVPVSSAAGAEMRDVVTMESEADALEVGSSEQITAPETKDSPAAAISPVAASSPLSSPPAVSSPVDAGMSHIVTMKVEAEALGAVLSHEEGQVHSVDESPTTLPSTPPQALSGHNAPTSATKSAGNLEIVLDTPTISGFTPINGRSSLSPRSTPPATEQDEGTVTMTVDVKPVSPEHYSPVQIPEDEMPAEQRLSLHDDSETEMLRKFVTRVKADKTAKAAAAASSRPKRRSGSMGSTTSSGSPVSRKEPAARALSSPRKPLGDKDTNMSPSPSKKRKARDEQSGRLVKPDLDDISPPRPKRRRKKMEAEGDGLFNPEFQKQQEAQAQPEQDKSKDEAATSEGPQPRRSTRAKNTRVQLKTAAQTANGAMSHIPVRLPGQLNVGDDFTTGVTLAGRRSEEKDLAAQTRANTRKNKGASVYPSMVLARQADDPQWHAQEKKAGKAGKGGVFDDVETSGDTEEAGRKAKKGKGKKLRWDDTLVRVQGEDSGPVVSQALAAGLVPDESTMHVDMNDANETLEVIMPEIGGHATRATSKRAALLTSATPAPAPATESEAAPAAKETEKPAAPATKRTRASRLQAPTPRKALATVPAAVNTAPAPATARSAKAGVKPTGIGAKPTGIKKPTALPKAVSAAAAKAASTGAPPPARMAARRTKVPSLGMGVNGTPAPKRKGRGI